MKIYFDGGCKPNPGKMEIAVVSDDGRIRAHRRIHDGTNNEAEWIAFIVAVELALPFAHENITILGDSNLVIQQASGNWKVKNKDLAIFRDDFNKIKSNFSNLKLEHVRREHNLAGHYIEDMN